MTGQPVSALLRGSAPASASPRGRACAHAEPGPARPGLRLPRLVGSLGTERCLRQRPLLSANLAGGGPTV